MMRQQYFSLEAHPHSQCSRWLLASIIARLKVIPLLIAGLVIVAFGGPVCIASSKTPTPSFTLTIKQSPIDLRYLNKNDIPAGRRGFIHAQGDQLVFADGTPARFWGLTLADNAMFATPSQIKLYAKRITSLGYNLVRIRHQPIIRWATLDRWIKSFKDQGVYLWLDLRRQHQLDRPHISVNKSDNKNQSAKTKSLITPKNVRCDFTPLAISLTKDFNAKYLGHINPYTKVAYRNEPAILAILLTGENDMTFRFSREKHAAKNWLTTHTFFKKQVRAFCNATHLPYESTSKPWLAGPSKVFLSELAYRFFGQLITPLKNIGVRSLIATSPFLNDMNLYHLPALASGDVIDARGDGKDNCLQTDPRTAANFIANIASAQVINKPLTISKWSFSYLAKDRFVGPMYVAAIASLQGWDAPIFSQNATQNATQNHPLPQNHNAKSDHKNKQLLTHHPNSPIVEDPAINSLMLAAAIAFRQSHIAPAQLQYCLRLSAKQFYSKPINAQTSAAIRTLAEKSKLTIALPDTPWLKWDKASNLPHHYKLLRDPNRQLLADNQQTIESDTGQIKRHFGEGWQTINTPKTQAYQGNIGNKRMKLASTIVEIRNKQAAIVFTSLDNLPLEESQKILITTTSPSVYNAKQKTFQTKYVRGIVSIRSTQRHLKLKSLDRQGNTYRLKKVEYTSGSYRFMLSGKTHWYLLTP